MSKSINELEAENYRLREKLAVLKNTLTAKTYNLGDKFHETIVEHLAFALGADFTFVGKLNNSSIETIALWGDGKILPNFSYHLKDTPCQNVVGESICSYSDNICDLYPKDFLLQEMGIKGYVGVPLFDSHKQPMGIIVALYQEPIEDVELAESALLLFANRAAAEIEHTQIYKQMKEQAALLEEAKEKAEESDRLKSCFLANISHEVRTPLNGIMGFTELLSSSDNLDENSRQQYLQNVINCSSQLLDVISDLVDIARIESGSIAPNIQTCSVSEVLSNAYERATSLAQKMGKGYLKLTLNILSTDDVLTTDEFRLNQILDKLLSNAIKFTNKGSIEINYNTTGDNAVFLVHDSGIGIAMSNYDVIFESFRQISVDGFSEGNGLGLTISRAFAELLGGSLTVKSEVGIGSVFQLTIPRELATKG